MSDSPKLKKNNRIVFFFFVSYYLHSVSLQKSSTLLHTNFRMFSRRHRIHFSFHRFPSCSSLHTRSCGLKKKVRNKQQNQKFFRNGSRTAISLFALFKQTLPLFSQLQFGWFKDTRPCGLKKKEGNRERRTKSKVFRMFEAMCTATSLFALFNCPPKRGQSYGVFQMWSTRVKIFD